MNNYKEIDKAFSEWKQGLKILDKVPPGWVTVEDYAKAKNKSLSFVAKFFKSMREQGKVETKKFNIDVGIRTYPVLHYKIKPDA